MSFSVLVLVLLVASYAAHHAVHAAQVSPVAVDMTLSPSGPDFLFGTLVQFSVTSSAEPTSGGSCDFSYQTPGASTWTTATYAGCAIPAVRLLLVGQYNFSVIYTAADKVSTSGTIWSTASVSTKPTLQFTVISSNPSAGAGATVTLAATFVADLSTMNDSWAASKPTITGTASILNAGSGAQIQSPQTPIWDGLVNWTIVNPIAKVNFQFSGDAYFKSVTLLDVVGSGTTTPASTTTAAGTTTPSSTTPTVTTTVPVTTTPVPTVTVPPGVQGQLANLDTSSLDALSNATALMDQTLKLSLGPLEAQSLIELYLSKMLIAAQTIRPTSQLISLLSDFMGQANTVTQMSGKALATYLQVLVELTKPGNLDGTRLKDLSGLIDSGFDALKDLVTNRVAQLGTETPKDLTGRIRDQVRVLLVGGLVANATNKLALISRSFSALSVRGTLADLFADRSVLPPLDGLKNKGDGTVLGNSTDFLVNLIRWTIGRFPSALSGINELKANAPVFSITLLDTNGNPLEISSDNPITFTFGLPANASQFADFKALAYGLWPCGEFDLDDVNKIATYKPSDAICDRASVFSCGFYNVAQGAWNQDGCQALKLTDSSVTCGCTHLTDFSVLIDPNGDPSGQKKKKSNVAIIAGAAAGGAALFIVVAIVLIIVLRGKCGNSHSKSFGSSSKSGEKIDTL